MLTDNHGRIVNYLRLAVTDRCNLRCIYCMPEQGIDWLPKKEQLTDEEMLRLCSLLTGMGIQKIRITGGEPLLRKNMLPFLNTLSRLNGLREISITTNGVSTAPLIPELKRIGIHAVNLSLDSLDRNRFLSITHRDALSSVLETLHLLLQHDIAVKINAVVMEGKNIPDIIPLAELTKELPVSVRFIEEMPFNGAGNPFTALHWNAPEILRTLKNRFPDIQKTADPPFSTSCSYQIPDYRGSVGIIAAYTRSFCGSCNRLRITPQGILKTCLYDDGVLNLKKLIRAGVDDGELQAAINDAIQSRQKDGWAAEKARNAKSPAYESMATIGG